ncbi:hypothetical protein [Ilumatobacter sp.]|uniref:hypothetical protein n=1 Tax=Ilumatobacter sp. TaxID=1967498 RepID=UPI00375175BC
MNNQPAPTWQSVLWSILEWTFKFVCAVALVSFSLMLAATGAVFGILRKTSS